MGDDGDGGVAVHLAEEHASDQCFAGPDLAGDEDEPFALGDGILEGSQGLLVLWSAQVEGGVGGVVERRPVQAEVCTVHGRAPSLTAVSAFLVGYRTASAFNRPSGSIGP